MNWKFWEKEGKQKTVELPKPNGVWYLKGEDGDPWPNKMMVPVTVLDVRKGWVRYKIGEGIVCCDERKTVSEFLGLYQKGVESPVAPKYRYSYEEWITSYLATRTNDDSGYAYPIVKAAFEAGRESVMK
ncbi:MAG: hypothetical protein M0P12_03075 [Paludibacteraceae bacterium]|nr:hypothetical protein [Paludibacteraceae bacterium]